MARELPQFVLYQIGDESSFQGFQSTSLGGWYHLKLVLPSWYPDKMPELFVDFPVILWKRDGTIIAGVSHAFHTHSNGPGGYVQICHCSPTDWDASKTCVGVFFKGIMWLEAYSHHLLTGKSIAEILEKWKGRLPWGEKKTEFCR